jgi:hypothetical protein
LGKLARVAFGLLAVRMTRDGNDAVIAYGVLTHTLRAFGRSRPSGS